MAPQPTATATSVEAPTRPQYTLNVVMDYNAKSLSADETILYPNHTGQTLNDLVLAVEPHYWPNCFELKNLMVDDVALTNYTLDGHKLSLQLPQALMPEAVAKLQISYTLHLPLIEPTNPTVTRPRIFGFDSRQINLVNWYPFVVPFIAGQWTLHDAWYYGEELVYDAADFKVGLKFSDGTPPPVVASSGELVATSADGTATYTLAAGRAFVFSMSPDFQVDSIKVGDVTVYSYYYDYSSFDVPGRLSLTTSAQALQIYSQRYGPYPHKTLSVIMGNFPDGMEYSASYFSSYGYYNLLAGSPTNSIYRLSVIYLAAHETAHQWWFEQVANDQALEPWLDEAMATYSEHIFFEAYYPAQLKLWWYVRSDQYDPKGWVDIPIYDGGGFRPYTNAVYFEGAHFLDDLRTRIGDEAFFAFLQDYLEQEHGKISTSADFFRILRAHTQTDFSDLIKKYFKNSY
ncbi:MAG TPA: M1 family metallopeptidase [Anaerolineales bacterium]|nr:M1 family metallopeptidase [Anaerolineales bacterium]